MLASGLVGVEPRYGCTHAHRGGGGERAGIQLEKCISRSGVRDVPHADVAFLLDSCAEYLPSMQLLR